MNIDLNSINPNRSEGPKRNDGSKSVSSSKTTSVSDSSKNTAATDNVSLSDSAKNLASIEAALKSLPEVNQSRVDEVKARIDRGEYKPDSANLAQKMLALE